MRSDQILDMIRTEDEEKTAYKHGTDLTTPELQTMLEIWQTVVLDGIFNKFGLPDHLIREVINERNWCIFCSHFETGTEDPYSCKIFYLCPKCPIYTRFGYRCDHDKALKGERDPLWLSWFEHEDLEGAWNILEVVYDLCLDRDIIGTPWEGSVLE